jgi:hypothetical protein
MATTLRLAIHPVEASLRHRDMPDKEVCDRQVPLIGVRSVQRLLKRRSC